MRKNNRVFKAIFIMFLLFFTATITISGCGPIGGAKGGVGKSVYYCPMHPTYTSDRPGDCPICNMKLVKKEAKDAEAPKAEEHKGHDMPAPREGAEEKTLDIVCIEHNCTMNNCEMKIKTDIKPGERVICPICGEVISTASGKVVEIIKQPPAMAAAGAGPTVMISQEKQQLIGVKTEPVKKIELTKIIRASGKIAYDPQLMVTQEEFIQAVNNEDNVKDSPLEDVINRARSLTEAARRKLKLLGMSDDQITQLQNSRKADTSLYLPGKGESVWAYVSIYEYEIGLVNIGTSVDIEAVAYPGQVFHGEVISINPILDAATRTNQVRIKIPNPDSKLKPEMFVSAKIEADLGEKLAVPKSAVLDTGIRKIVYLSKEGDILELREVRLGQGAGDYFEVLDGLAEGDIVVTSGNFLIDSESRLKAAQTGSAEHKH